MTTTTNSIPMADAMMAAKRPAHALNDVLVRVTAPTTPGHKDGARVLAGGIVRVMVVKGDRAAVRHATAGMQVADVSSLEVV